MSNTHIHIDHIHINGQGIPPPIAQAATQGLGQALLTGLAQHSWSPQQRGTIGDLNLGIVHVKNPHDAGHLRQAIAQAVIHAILTQTGERREQL